MQIAAMATVHIVEGVGFGCGFTDKGDFGKGVRRGQVLRLVLCNSRSLLIDLNFLLTKTFELNYMNPSELIK